MSTGSPRSGHVSVPSIRIWRSSEPCVHRSHRARLSGDYEWTHHLVVLVLEDVAVPDEAACGAELRLDACNLTGVGDDRILEPGLSRLRRPGWPDGRAGVRVKLLPVDYLELHRVYMNGVCVLGVVEDLPDLGGTEGRRLCGSVGPHHGHPHTGGVHSAQEAGARPNACQDLGVHFVQ